MLVKAQFALRSLPEIQLALFGLTLASYWQIRNGHAPRDFWKQTVRYVREPPGRDDWQTWRDTVRLGTGDCEDLATALAACRWAAGDKGARAMARRVRPGLIHITTRFGDGRVCDPSKLLGMGPPR